MHVQFFLRQMNTKKQTTSAPANTFSIRQLVAAYNAYYRFGKYSDSAAKSKRRSGKGAKTTYPKLSFRVYSEEKSKDKEKNELRESRKFVINLRDFEAVSDFKKAYESGKANKVNVEPKEMSEEEYLNYIINNHVYDIHLRSCLGIASRFVLYPQRTTRTRKSKTTETDDVDSGKAASQVGSGKADNDENGSSEQKTTKDEEQQIPAANIYYDYLIPQLGFTKRKSVEAKDYIDTLKEYFKGDALKIKAYNKIFPHPVRNTDKGISGINYVFLQRLVPDHLSVISDVIDGKEDNDIINKVVVKQYPKNSKSEVKKYSGQIVIYAINGLPKVQRERKGIIVEEDDKQWAKNLAPSANDKTIESMVKLYRDLVAVKAFANIIRSSADAAAEQDKDISECFEQYKTICDNLTKFNNKNATIGNTFKDLTRYIVDACCLLKNSFAIKDPLKLIAASIKSKYDFRITKSIREKFDNLITAADTDDKNVLERNEQTLNEIAAECEQNIGAISMTKGYDFLDTSFDVYSNVGKFCGVKLPKNYRVSMGIAIVKWLNERIDLLVAENKKREVLVIDIKE